MKNERRRRARGAVGRSSSGPGAGAGPRFDLGDEICALADIGNEGTYPHKEIGEILVYRGDRGLILETSQFLGEVYYTVEFADRAAVVALRAREMGSLGSVGFEAAPRSGRRGGLAGPWETRAHG